MSTQTDHVSALAPDEVTEAASTPGLEREVANVHGPVDG